jgi:hypothetical protein
MNYTFDKLVAVSGKPGLFHLVANRDNGLLLQEVQTSRTQFYSVRQHQFTPLASIGIYTDDDSIELKEVFKRMQASSEPAPFDDLNSVASVTTYFENVLPEYDKDKVKINDMRKVIKWFGFLKEKEMLSLIEEKAEEISEEKAVKSEVEKADPEVKVKAEPKVKAKKESTIEEKVKKGAKKA